MDKEFYNSIEEILGDKSERFFSNGYKNVKHCLKDIWINPRNNTINANGSVFYPVNWSSKGEEILKPHLSTLDIFAFSIYLNILYINEVYNLCEEKKKSTWIRKVKIKAGNEAQYSLDNIAITSKLVNTEEKSLSDCTHCSTFENEIMGLKTEVVLEHYVNEFDTEEKHINNKDMESGEISYYYNGSQNKNKDYEIANINIDKQDQTISSSVKIRYDSQKANGIYGLPFFSVIDTFVCASQLLQALIYNIDEIDRKNSNNLWMRKIEFEYKSPIYIRKDGFKQSAKVCKTKIISMNDTSWRIADFKYNLDLPSNPICLSVSLAHQLPTLVPIAQSTVA